MLEEMLIKGILDNIYSMINAINRIQDEIFIEDLDYIKIHLENAINYKEIKEENIKGDNK